MWAFHLGWLGFLIICVNEVERRIQESVSGLGEGRDSLGSLGDL